MTMATSLGCAVGQSPGGQEMWDLILFHGWSHIPPLVLHNNVSHKHLCTAVCKYRKKDYKADAHVKLYVNRTLLHHNLYL